MNTNNEITKQYISALEGLVEVDVVYGSKHEMLFRGNFIPDRPAVAAEILEKIYHLPGKAIIETTTPSIVIRIRMPDKAEERLLPSTNIVLFILTICTTLLVGANMAGVDFISSPNILWGNPFLIVEKGAPFSFSLLTILLFHEFGHYIASRKHGVNVTLPYFIPFPSMIGTAGAVIRIKSPFMNRRQLFDVGAAGPLAGIFIAIPIAIWGLSEPVFVSELIDKSELINLGEPLLFSFIARLVEPSPPEGYIAVINPVAFAAWVGFLVTMLNLLPIGQLDGGHIMYAMFGKNQAKISLVIFLALVVLSFWWLGWVFWAFLLFLLFRGKHPPTVLDEIPLDNKRMAIGYLCIVIFILCFMPIPFSGY